ncbi:Mitochondrial ribosomal protein L47 [Paragonimus heterotremus]|uniref:Large ribosomal subunit protein uL29m n=1 Tax=Paragonimus heterotremus TaxID=100268 RepID=A0A8J4SK83_9TREM|nr:Mitochondrial ribosomal protein L47 [Paragonimus heterotremus]
MFFLRTGLSYLLSKAVLRRPTFSCSCLISTGVLRRGLEEFFDDPKLWELRLKNNSDLHKLWYILLKERNMLMTMEEEHNRCLERMPNAERFEKVEESMENIMHVIEERNRASAELEQGEWIGPTVVHDVDALGRPCTRLTSEHTEPRVADCHTTRENEQMWGEKTVQLLRIEREKRLRSARDARLKERYARRKEQWDRLDFLDEKSIDNSAS